MQEYISGCFLLNTV